MYPVCQTIQTKTNYKTNTVHTMSVFGNEYKQSLTGVIAKTITTCNQLTSMMTVSVQHWSRSINEVFGLVGAVVHLVSCSSSSVWLVMSCVSGSEPANTFLGSFTARKLCYQKIALWNLPLNVAHLWVLMTETSGRRGKEVLATV